MDGGQPNYFTINGRAFPATDTIPMRVGETLKVRFIGSNNGFIRPMQIPLVLSLMALWRRASGGRKELIGASGEPIKQEADPLMRREVRHRQPIADQRERLQGIGDP